MEKNNISMEDFFELLKDKNDDEIKRILKDCNKEALIEISFNLFSSLKAKEESFDTVYDLIKKVYSNNESIKEWIGDILQSNK